jgi:DtxR family Mn-dependent transcriptional regulator
MGDLDEMEPSDALTPATEDYLKAILTIGNGEPVSTSELADALGVAPASATNMTKRLTEAGLAERLPYRGATLTPSGRRVAVELLRHHRLIELYLHKALGIPWDRVHDEAERWEHVISEEVEARMDEILGFPTHDPHGAPIPSADLDYQQPERRSLATLTPGQRGRVVEVCDDDPALLRYVGELGLYPGATFAVERGQPFDGGPITLHLSSAPAVSIVVDGRAALSVFVEPAG